MRIGICALDSLPGLGGGVDVYTLRLIESLTQFAPTHDYLILVNAKVYNAWRDILPSEVSILPIYEVASQKSLPVRAYRSLRQVLGLRNSAHFGNAYIASQIDSLHLDVLHYPKHVIFPLSVTSPCVVSFFDIQHEYYPQFFTAAELEWRAQQYRASAEKAIHIVSSSNYTAHSLLEKYQISREKITVLPVGLADSFGKVTSSMLAEVKQKYELPDGFLFYPANPWPHKNHARLMAALRVYGSKYGKALPLVLSGRLRDERRDTISLAIAAGIQENVMDLGFVALHELAALYHAATLLVFPSLFEGFGMPLVEAMACGCPIAAANATAIPECVQQAALLFDPLDIEGIADAIHKLLTDMDSRARLIQEGYQQLKRFKWEEIVPQLIRVYEMVANE